MTKYNVKIYCWTECHATELLRTRRQEEKLARQIPKLMAVCPQCKYNGRGNQSIFISDGQTLITPLKVYRCFDGHATIIQAFAGNRLSVRYGPHGSDFINIDGSIEDLPDLINSGVLLCQHDGCNQQLAAIDDVPIEYPVAANIKTKTRVGDIWDKNNISPVRNGYYDSDGTYHESRSEQINKERLKHKRASKIQSPGQTVYRPTTRRAPRKNKNEI